MYAGGDPPVEVSARIWMGSACAVGRIMFAGHFAVNDSTLRRAMLINERDSFDVVKLRRSLARLNALGLFEPLTIADLVVARRDDGVTADVTIPLRDRRRRWWSVSGPLIPGIGALQASIGSRLPPWGRGGRRVDLCRAAQSARIRPADREGGPAGSRTPGRGSQEWLRDSRCVRPVPASDAHALRTHAPGPWR